MERLRIAVAGRGNTYLPLSVAQHLGYFADEGLTAAIDHVGYGHSAISSLRSGATDVVVGGIWRPFMYGAAGVRLPVIAGICGKVPLVLVSRTRQLPPLDGARIAVDGGAPAPLMALQMFLRASGVNPASIAYLANFDAIEAEELFRVGIADLWLAPFERADEFAGDGANVVADFTQLLPSIPWTVCYTSSALTDRRRALDLFVSAIGRALHWLHAARLADVIDVVTELAADSRKHIEATVARSRRVALWPTSPVIPPMSIQPWTEAIKEFGLVPRRTDLSLLAETLVALDG